MTCSGLCPGLNDVIRALVMGLYHHYRVKRIHGSCSGYKGFIPRYQPGGCGLVPAGREAFSLRYSPGERPSSSLNVLLNAAPDP